ncbi:MAG: FtsQ-type POTRA domain-containing protein [Treponema sp.]|nr:FtsQ-type POTRA domain-containing protein [Treponema sp.]
MAGDYTFDEKAACDAPGRLEKILKAVIVIAFLVLAGKMVWLMGITPFRPLSRVDVSGYAGIPMEQVLATAGITALSSYFSVNTRQMEQALMTIPVIQSARVFRHFPDRLQIVLEDRRPVAAALVNSGGRTVPVLFDSEGVIFQIGGDSEALARLVVVSGLVIENPFPGMRLPAMFSPFFGQLERIGTYSPQLLSAVSEIRINPKPFSGFDLVLYPAHSRVRVRIHELNEDRLRYTLLMVDVLEAREPGIESIDFRSSMASYILRGASF